MTHPATSFAAVSANLFPETSVYDGIHLASTYVHQSPWSLAIRVTASVMMYAPDLLVDYLLSLLCLIGSGGDYLNCQYTYPGSARCNA